MEVHHLDKNKNSEKLEEEFGDILFSLVNLSRHLSVSIEKALNKSNLKFIKRFQEMEKISQENSKNFSELSIEEMNSLWEKAKTTLS